MEIVEELHHVDAWHHASASKALSRVNERVSVQPLMLPQQDQIGVGARVQHAVAFDVARAPLAVFG